MTSTQSARSISSLRNITCIGLAACGLLLAGSSLAAGQGRAQADAQYQAEKAACNNGKSNQDKATCLREAAAARDAAARGGLTNPDPAQLKENAMKRCEGLPQINRVDCEKRMNGGGIADGSVREGGIFRETVTIIPGQPDTSK
ncbi:MULTISPECIES: hypothetical protein [unclassified Herbaspirillum]|uniref:hypothetical protein n=1 Tax=unclassified Herbaspirillum TaxID=2624150 RepID=UPI001154796A|nr:MULTISPECIES: hypothetical protein [unclassified Herbaspirillum]MBB5392652.1 hypothetical protein [Herbaspirillum sp. SJZ102]TQK06288.1 hypothetical protein FB599_2434 [Herbaspirillum sp. SJZ130]TQK12234.1 hypothetical protein FB598_2186 [Herbaspirillum sp. SJZ106]